MAVAGTYSDGVVVSGVSISVRVTVKVWVIGIGEECSRKDCRVRDSDAVLRWLRRMSVEYVE